MLWVPDAVAGAVGDGRCGQPHCLEMLGALPDACYPAGSPGLTSAPPRDAASPVSAPLRLSSSPRVDSSGHLGVRV
jgi:hypothetical protein